MKRDPTLQEVLIALNQLRGVWTRMGADPEFETRTQWVAGVIKGIDLSVWTVHKEWDRTRGGKG